MKERLYKLRDVLARPRPIPFLEGIRAHLTSLPPSDKLVAIALGIFVIVLSLVSMYQLERHFLVEVPSRGGSLTEGVLGSPRFVNPLLALSDADRDLSSLTYAGLMGYGKNGELVPVLAEGYSISEDGKMYTFVLRESVRFSDGSPVTSEDVVFTVEKAQDPTLKSPELQNWANIKVEALDARTVQFTLPKAYAPFLADTTLGILPAHLWRDITNEEFPFAPAMSEPVGAGPYEVSNVQRNKNGVIERYELRAHPDYALGEAYISHLVFIFFARTEDLQNAIARGRVESAHGVLGGNTLQTPYSRVFGVFFNQNQNPLFARLEVRKALSLALNRTKLVTETLGGLATAVYGPVPLGGVLESVSTGGNELAVAKATLETGGWEFSDESGTWKNEKEGLELRVSIKTSNVPELKVVAEHIKNDWGALGVPVSLELYEPGDLTQNVIRPRNYDALLFGMVVGRDNDLFAFWESSQRNDPGLNIAMYANKRVDDLLESIRIESNPAIIAEDLKEVNELIAKDFPAVFTHAPDFVYRVPENLRGIMLSGIASPTERLGNIRFWYRDTQFVWSVFEHL
jgi:peptide/nickel transport system substrate-binding protein